MVESESKEFNKILSLLNTFSENSTNNLILNKNGELSKGDFVITLTPHNFHMGVLIQKLIDLKILYIFRINGSKIKDRGLLLLTNLNDLFFLFIENRSLITMDDIPLYLLKFKYESFKIHLFKIRFGGERVVYYFKGPCIHIESGIDTGYMYFNFEIL